MIIPPKSESVGVYASAQETQGSFNDDSPSDLKGGEHYQAGYYRITAYSIFLFVSDARDWQPLLQSARPIHRGFIREGGVISVHFGILV